MPGLVVDTHALLWYLLGSSRCSPDMPDRIIGATALHLGLPLITRDGKIRASDLRTIW